MMAEMKALTSLPTTKPVTMKDVYQQQQILTAKIDALIGRTRFDVIAPGSEGSPPTVQEVYQQQVSMVAEMKEMMAEMKQMITVYQGRVTDPKQ